jgi:hypothetical protein
MWKHDVFCDLGGTIVWCRCYRVDAMTISMLQQTRRTLGDYGGAWSGSDAEVQALIDRGTRDMGRRGMVIQKRATLTTVSGEPFVALPSDHVDAFAIFRAGHAMQEVEPEAIQRLDPRATSGPPERYAVIVTQLALHPTPDAVYSLDLLYFSDDVTALPAACQVQPPLFAAAQALERWHRLYESHRLLSLYRHHPSQELLVFFQQEVGLMAAALSPYSRDGLDLYKFPTYS